VSNKFPFIANEFNRKRALVTGGTAGIGEAVARRLLDGGANFLLHSLSPMKPKRTLIIFVLVESKEN
jgi:NAD(P)-dependent dehydrogenase (short-subunit alcohol dehydrogenase family)